MSIDDRGRRAAGGIHRAVDTPPDEDPLERFDRFRARKRRNQRIGVGVLVLLIVVPTTLVAIRAFRPSQVSVAPPGLPAGTILFGHWHPNVAMFDWYTVLPDGSGARDLHVRSSCARWWPDGSKIWITNDAARSAGHPLRPATIDPDGSGLRPLDATHDPNLNLGCGDVSPDGRRMVLEGFNEQDHSVDGIFTVRASDGGGLVRLTRGHDGYPSYSPDGSKVVFMRTSTRSGVVPDAAGALFVMHADGSGLRRITPWGYAFLQQSWSPDGSWIAFQKPFGELYLVHPDGSGLHRVPVSLPTGTGVVQPSWSPDGSRIVFSLQQGGEAGISTVRPDGSDLRRVTGTPGVLDSGPSWGRAPA